MDLIPIVTWLLFASSGWRLTIHQGKMDVSVGADSAFFLPFGLRPESSFAAHVSSGEVFCLVRGGRDSPHPDPLPKLIFP